MCPDLGIAATDDGTIADRDGAANIKKVVAHEADGLADFQGGGPAVVGYAIKAVEVGDVSVVADLEGFEVADDVAVANPNSIADGDIFCIGNISDLLLGR